jgi:hypothetical protein
MRRQAPGYCGAVEDGAAGGDRGAGAGDGVIGWERFAPPLIRRAPHDTFSRFAREGVVRLVRKKGRWAGRFLISS